MLREKLEGSTDESAVVGWDHPGLLPTGAELLSIYLDAKGIVSSEQVDAMLDKLAAMTVRIEAPGSLTSLTKHAFPRGALKPWYGQPRFCSTSSIRR